MQQENNAGNRKMGVRHKGSEGQDLELLLGLGLVHREALRGNSNQHK
jgi:hypothetical protein